MIKIILLLFVICLPRYLYAAALPFTETQNASETSQSQLSGKVNIQLPSIDEFTPLTVKLINLNTKEVVNIGQGEYLISQGEYQILVYKALLDDDIDHSYAQFKAEISVGSSETVNIDVPELNKRRFTSWHDYLTISLQLASIGDDYEVSSILNEFYTKQTIANTFPEFNSISANDSDAQSRTGLSINYKHFFANSDWLMYAELFADQDSNSSLNRSGFGLGGGKYWEGENSNYWVAGGIGSETAKWNDITVGGNTSISISGENSNETLNVEAGMIYVPMNLSFGARFDLANQSVMFNVGYVFGGKKQGFIDPEFVN